MEDVIDGTMTIVAPFTLLIAEAIDSSLVHVGTTMLASVRTTQGGTQA